MPDDVADMQQWMLVAFGDLVEEMVGPCMRQSIEKFHGINAEDTIVGKYQSTQSYIKLHITNLPIDLF